MLPSTVRPDESTSKNEATQRHSISSENDPFQDLKDSIHVLQVEQNELTKHVEDIANEHQRMKNEVLSSIDDHLQQLAQIIDNAKEDRNFSESLLEMWHIAVAEIEHLEKVLADKTAGKEFDKRIEEVKAGYSKALESLSEELAAARIELRNLKNDLQNKNSQLDENKKIVENISVELAKKQVKDAFMKERDMLSKIMILESSLAENKKLLSEKDEEICSLNVKLDELQSLNEELKNQNFELKAQKVAAQKDAKESLLTTEKAVLEKEEAVYKEQQALKEIQLLKNSINQAVEQTASRYKSEILNIQMQYDDRIKAMINEVQQLEMENNQKQSMFERAVREKEAVESELQSLYEKNARGSPVSNSVFEDICKKLTEMERSKKEVELEAESLQTLLKDMKLSHEQEMQLIQDECKRLKTRLQHLQMDFQNVLTSRTQLSDEIELLKKRCHKAEKELANAKSTHQSDISLLEQKLQKKEHASYHQLQMAEERHKRALVELQHLLDAQYDINNKWKEEVQELTKKSEAKVKELYEDNIRLHQQNDELSRTLQQKQCSSSGVNYSLPYEADGNQLNTIYVNR